MTVRYWKNYKLYFSKDPKINKRFFTARRLGTVVTIPWVRRRNLISAILLPTSLWSFWSHLSNTMFLITPSLSHSWISIVILEKRITTQNILLSAEHFGRESPWRSTSSLNVYWKRIFDLTFLKLIKMNFQNETPVVPCFCVFCKICDTFLKFWKF